MLVTEHTRLQACKGTGNLPSGLSNACQSAAWVYFAGFGVVGFGLVLLGSIVFLSRHESRYHRVNRLPSDYMIQVGRGGAGSPER